METKYYKFNNSRSNKMPFFVYIKYADGDFTGTNGSKWFISKSEMIEITKEEYDACEKSDLESRTLLVGDTIVVTEYVPSKLRYGKISNISGNIITLESGTTYHRNHVRNANILIHKN